MLELFQDVERALCPTSRDEIRAKLKRLKVWQILAGLRGRPPVDPEPFIQTVANLARLLSDCPEIVELDVNPVRVLESGEVVALDARMRVVRETETAEGRKS